MNVREQIARGTSWSFLAQVISFGFGFIISVLLARWLGPESYGLIPLTMTIITVFGIFADFGVGPSSSKYISEYRARDIGVVKSIVKDGFILKLIFGSVVSTICFFSAGLIAEFMHVPRLLSLLQISSIMLFFMSFLRFFDSLFQGFQRLEFTTLTSFFQNITKLVFSLGLVYLGYGVVGAIAGFTIASVITALLASVIVFLGLYNRLPAPSSNKYMGRNILKYSMPLAVTSISYFIYMQSDILMLGYFTTSLEVGFYSIAQQIINTALLPCTALLTAITPMIAYLYGKNDKESRETSGKLFDYSIKYGLLLMIPMVFGIVALAEPAVSIIFGERYIRAALLLSLLSVYLIPRAIGVVGSSYLVGAGRAGIIAKLTAITAVSNFILNLFLIPQYQAIGAVASTLMTHSAYIGISVFMAKKIYKIQFSRGLWMSIVKFIFASVIMYYMVISLKYLAVDLKGLLVVITLGAIAYFILLLCVKEVIPEDIKKIKYTIWERQ